MFINYVAQALTADLYPAALVGYSKSLGFTPSGLSIQVNGYSDEDVMERYLTVLLQGQCVSYGNPSHSVVFVLCVFYTIHTPYTV